MTPPVRIVIVDDHPAFRRGLRFMLEQTEGFAVVAEAADGAEAVTTVAAAQPDVVLMDVAMPGLDGIAATRHLLAADARVAVLVLTMFDDDETVFAALRAGARGYLLKGADQDEIERAVRAAAAGEVIFSAGVARHITAYFAALPRPGAPRAEAASVPPPFPQLTSREREILAVVAEGATNAQVAARLFLSEKTVRNNVSMIFAKLHVADRANAVIQARLAGLGGGDGAAGPFSG